MRMIDRKIYNLTTGMNARDRNVIYGVKIAKGNSDPNLSVTYTDDSVGFLPSSGNNGNFLDNGWKSRFPFNKIKPCLLKDGVIQYYLNPDNFAKKANGTTSDLNSGTDGNVMIEFPKMWYSITQDSDYVYVRYSNAAQSGFTDWGMSYKGVIKNKFFIGAYSGSVVNNKLCSLSGQVPIENMTIGGYRALAQVNGNGYEILCWNKLTLLQILYLIRFKSLDGQTALGMGIISGDSYVNTGTVNALGMNYGANGSTQVKFCGIEDFWGNAAQYIDGLVLNASGLGTVKRGSYASADGNFNDTANGYTITGTENTVTLGYISAVKGTNELGFFPSALVGSGSTYFCDKGYVASTSAMRFPTFGGNYVCGDQAGPFHLRIATRASDLTDCTGARLIYCGYI